MKKTQILSKVMKAAWTIFRKGGKSFSQALTSAWGWAKKQSASTAPKFWTNGDGLCRVYLGDAYAQVSLKEKSPRGYYQNHRACKGESFATGWVKAVGMTIEAAMELAQQFVYEMGERGQNVELVASKF